MPNTTDKSADTGDAENVKHGNVKTDNLFPKPKLHLGRYNGRAKGRARKKGHAEAVAARRLQSIQLRRSGATLEQIARVTNVSVMQAFRDVKAAQEATMQLVFEQASALVARELDRLDGLLVSLAPGIKSGHVAAIKEARRIGESRRKLLGLDNTKPTELIVTPGPEERPLARVSDADLLAQMAKATEVLRLAREASEEIRRTQEPPPPPAPLTPAELYELELERRASCR